MGTRPKGDEPQKREIKPKRGPQPELLKSEAPWEEAEGNALRKKPREGGRLKPKK